MAGLRRWVESLSAPFAGALLTTYVHDQQTAFMQLRAEQDGERLLAGDDGDPDQMGRTFFSHSRNIENPGELAAV